MSQQHTAAWILAATDSGHQDRIYTVYTQEQGLLRLMGYGMRAQRPRVTASLQLFSCVRLDFSPGRYGLGVIKDASLLRAGRPIREELPRMAYAMFVAEILIGLCPPHAADREFFVWLEPVFGALEQRNPRITAVAAAWQILDRLGYRPELEECVLCRSEEGQAKCFSSEAGGIVCQRCSADQPAVVMLDNEVLTCINDFLALDWHNPQLKSVRGTVLLQAERLLLQYLAVQMGQPLRSVAVIRDLVGGSA